MLGKTRPGQSQRRTFLKVKIELLLSISEDTKNYVFSVSMPGEEDGLKVLGMARSS